MSKRIVIGLALMALGLLLIGWGLSETGAGAQGIFEATGTAYAPTAQALGTQAAGWLTAQAWTDTPMPSRTAVPTATAAPTLRPPDMVWRIERARVLFLLNGEIVLEVWRDE